MKKPIDNTLLRKFVAGTCSEEERKSVNDYLHSEEGKAHLVGFLKAEWDKPDGGELSEELMELYRSELWARIALEEKSNPVKTRKVALWQQPVWRYAAVITLFLLAGALFYTRYTRQEAAYVYEERVNGAGRRSTLVLRDGTKVYLGAGSSIRFPRSFGGDSRDVYLDGEAFFEVARDTLHPFRIHTGNICTQVLGTSFKVKAFEDDVQVSVATGKVQVARMLGSGSAEILAVLTPGEELDYRRAAPAPQKRSFHVDDILQWKAGKMVFNNVPFGEMLQEIGRNYDLSFDLQRDDLRTIPITVTLDNGIRVDELINSLSMYVGFQYTINHHKITIR